MRSIGVGSDRTFLTHALEARIEGSDWREVVQADVLQDVERAPTINLQTKILMSIVGRNCAQLRPRPASAPRHVSQQRYMLFKEGSFRGHPGEPLLTAEKYHHRKTHRTGIEIQCFLTNLMERLLYVKPLDTLSHLRLSHHANGTVPLH